jgi:hypothetical protein
MRRNYLLARLEFMRIGKKLFPYPVINNSASITNFKTSSFALLVDLLEKDNSIVLQNIRYETTNDMIRDLLADNLAQAIIIVECSSTLFRKVYTISDNPTNVQIPISNLRDKVEISCVVYATQDIECYHDSDFLDEYENQAFRIEKYDILGIDDGFTTKITYDEEDEDKVSSIFLVIKDDSIIDERIIVEENVRKIIIRVPEKQFGIYDKMKTNSSFYNIFFSLLIIPALSYELQKLQQRDLEDIKFDYNWFSSIENAFYKIHSKSLDDETFKKANPLVLAQEIMNYPVTKAIDEFFTIAITGYPGDEYEE